MSKSGEFQRYDAEVAQNTFYYSPKELRGVLKQEFEFRDLGHLLNDGTELSNWLKNRTDTILTTLRTKYKSGLTHRNHKMEMSGNQHYMMVTLQTEINPRSTKGNPYNNFQALRRQYTKLMDAFAKDLTEKVSNLGEKLLTTRKANKEKFRDKDGNRNKEFKLSNNEMVMGNAEVSKFSHLSEAGHDKGFEVLESKLQAAMDAAFNDEYPRRVDRNILNRDLKKLGLDLEIERNDKTGEYYFRMQSRVDNQQQGFLSAKQREDFDKQLTNAINLLDNQDSILNLQGSSSMLDMKMDESAVKLLNPFEGIKNVKVKKPKLRKKKTRKPVVSKAALKVKKSPMSIAAVVVRKINLSKAKSQRRKEGGGGTSFNPLQMIAMINKELPKTVMDNMGAPRLENQTGRFARSVRVTDIVQTPKGFPSIGYTYQRNPYQVFEEGSSGPWANGHRDPRQLIDQSIREIAVQFAMGRLYTRRL